MPRVELRRRGSSPRRLGELYKGCRQRLQDEHPEISRRPYAESLVIQAGPGRRRLSEWTVEVGNRRKSTPVCEVPSVQRPCTLWCDRRGRSLATYPSRALHARRSDRSEHGSDAERERRSERL